MRAISNFLTSRWGPIITGIVVGVLAPVLVKPWATPATWASAWPASAATSPARWACTAPPWCSTSARRSSALCWARWSPPLLFREFKPRAGSAPLVRFVLGMFAMIGALVFLGCPWRAYLRLAGGDWNAILGILGLVAGIGLGVALPAQAASAWAAAGLRRAALGWVMPVFMVGLLRPADRRAPLRPRCRRQAGRPHLLLRPAAPAASTPPC